MWLRPSTGLKPWPIPTGYWGANPGWRLLLDEARRVAGPERGRAVGRLGEGRLREGSPHACRVADGRMGEPVYRDANLIQRIDALIDAVVEKLKFPDVDFRSFHEVLLFVRQWLDPGHPVPKET